MLASCAPVNNITKDKNEKTDIIASTEILVESSIVQENVKVEEKKLEKEDNPPVFSVEFFKNQKNLDNINCYSNEGGVWEKSKIKFNDSILSIDFREPFLPRRGRINCSLNDNGKWRWFGTQFTIKLN